MTIVKEFSKGLWDQLPPFKLVLGLCPVLAVTTPAEYGAGMGVATTFVLLMSNILVSLIRKAIPPEVRIAAFIVIIASFVVITEMVMQAYAYSLYQALGIFIPLIVVNCIILGRAEAFASKKGVFDSIADAIGIGLGFTISLTVLGAIREIFGGGTIFGLPVFGEAYRPMKFFVEAPGAFVCLGILLAVINWISYRRKARG
ncbi:MAG: electron transport complex subunit E [Deltaproteobacteria bacterium]|nr:electron transport complex subunit E [Deltaproteobacteria bacterium]